MRRQFGADVPRLRDGAQCPTHQPAPAEVEYRESVCPVILKRPRAAAESAREQHCAAAGCIGIFVWVVCYDARLPQPRPTGVGAH